MLKFLLELAAFAALAWSGWRLGSRGGGTLPGLVLAVVLVAAAIAIWARWCAPRAAHRLPTRVRAPLELAVFAVAAIGLALTGALVLAVVFAALVVVNAILLTVQRQWDG